MSVPTLAPGRAVSRVTAKQRLGPDAQVDDKAIVIALDDPSLTDPFLALAEDWFSEPGFEWHPHRGLETITIVLDGVLEHGDNIGNAGALQPGDLQWGGPFVMNKRTEITQAFTDFHAGKFGQVPRQARLKYDR